MHCFGTYFELSEYALFHNSQETKNIKPATQGAREK